MSRGDRPTCPPGPSRGPDPVPVCRCRRSSSFGFPKSAGDREEPHFERGLDVLEPVHRDPALHQQAVDLGDGVALGALGREMAEPSGPTCTCAPNAVPSSRCPARSGSEHSTWTSKEDPAISWEIGPWRMTLPRSTMATASQVRSTSSRRCDDSIDGATLGDERQDHVAHFEHAGGVEAVHGLVEDQQMGVPEQAGRDAQPLAHAHGVLRHLVVGPVEDADALERRLDAALGRRLTRRREDLQVLATGQMAVEAGLVDDRADSGQRHVAVSGDPVAEQRHGAGVGVGQAQAARGSASSCRRRWARGSRRRTPRGTRSSTSLTAMFVPESLGQPVGLDGPLAFTVGPGRGVGQGCRRHHRPALLHSECDVGPRLAPYTRYSTGGSRMPPWRSHHVFCWG